MRERDTEIERERERENILYKVIADSLLLSLTNLIAASEIPVRLKTEGFFFLNVNYDWIKNSMVRELRDASLVNEQNANSILLKCWWKVTVQSSVICSLIWWNSLY